MSTYVDGRHPTCVGVPQQTLSKRYVCQRASMNVDGGHSKYVDVRRCMPTYVDVLRRTLPYVFPFILATGGSERLRQGRARPD